MLILGATGLGDLPPSRPAADILAARPKALQDFRTALRGELRYVDSGNFIRTEQPKLVIARYSKCWRTCVDL